MAQAEVQVFKTKPTWKLDKLVKDHKDEHGGDFELVIANAENGYIVKQRYGRKPGKEIKRKYTSYLCVDGQFRDAFKHELTLNKKVI